MHEHEITKRSEERCLELVLAGEQVVSVYQPIVELAGGATVAFEALARGPHGSPLEMPGALFGAAARAGRLVELDWACRAAAVRGAVGTALERPAALFVNVEPVAAMAGVPQQFASLMQAAPGRLRIVFELTERALTQRPAEILRAVRDLRALGAGIALDDVGVDPRSLALMPFVAPDVVKLDLSLVQGEPSMAMARTMHAVNAYAQTSDAIVLAEGIETDEHLQRALSLGATHGQGWLFGRPAPAPSHRVVDAALPAPTHNDSQPAAATPYELVNTSGRVPRTAPKRLLLSLSRQLELQAQALGPECVVIAGLQRHQHFTPNTQALYTRLASQTAFAGIIGEHVPATPAPGVRGGHLPPGDPLAREWNVCVISPHFATAMVATDLGDTGADMDRRFNYHLTYDRDEVTAAARTMMTRITDLDT